MNNNNTHEKELIILENIYNEPGDVRQRELAKLAGLSLGMTNAIIKRLVLKGLLTIKRVNNRNIHYIVTPTGIEAITKKSYRYFKRTIKNVTNYRVAIEDLIEEIENKGYEGIILKGSSDLDFIVEHACRKNDLKYIKDDNFTGNFFLLYSEKYLPDKEDKGVDKGFLQTLLI
jgi:DNA-binding MarR family transcriptional regulator